MLINNSLAIQQQKLDIFYKNNKFGWIGLILLWFSLLAVYGFPNNIATIILIFLALIGILLHILNNYLYQKWQQQRFLFSAIKLISTRKKWHYIAIILSAYNGIIIGVSPFFLLNIEDIARVYLVTTLLILTIFGSSVVSGTSKRIHIIWTLTTIQIIAFMLITSGNQHFLILGIMIVTTGIPTAILMNLYFNKLYSDSIKLGFENKKLLEETEKLKEIVTRESAEKSWLMKTMCHDLRQPIQAINLFLESLKLSIKDHKQLDIVDKTKQASQQLTNMIQTLHDMNNINSVNLPLKIEPIIIGTIINTLSAEFEKLASIKNIKIHTNTIEATVFSDKILLTRIISNLLDNAIKHNNNCDIYIITKLYNNKLELKICDTGIGIKDKDLKNIFNAHYQVNPSQKGLGLGLSLVKKAANALAINMTVNSNNNQGTCFILNLKTLP